MKIQSFAKMSNYAVLSGKHQIAWFVNEQDAEDFKNITYGDDLTVKEVY